MSASAWTGATALFTRAMRSETRTWRPALLRLALGGTMVLMVAVASMESWRGAAGRELLGILAWTAIIGTTLLGLVLFPGAIADEKEDGTLPLLRMSGMGALAVLMGKGLARLWDLLLALAVVPPFAVLAATLGGVSVDQTVAVVVLAAAHAVLLAGVGLLASTVTATQAAASALALALLMAWWLLPALAWSLPQWDLLWGPTPPGWTLVAAHVGEWLTNGIGFVHLAKILSTGWSGSVVAAPVWLNLGAGALALVLAWLAFPLFADSEPAAPAAAPARTWRGRLHRLLAGLRQRPPAGALAVAWRDFHWRGGGWVLAVVKPLLPLAVGLAIILLDQRSLVDRETWRGLGQGLMVTGLAWGIIDVGAQLSRTFTDEIRQQTLGALLTLPISAATLVRIKVLAALRAGASVWAVLLIGAFLAPEQFFEAVGEMLSHLAGWCSIATVAWFWALCLWGSVMWKRLALMMALIGMVATWFLVGMAMAMTYAIFRGGSEVLVFIVMLAMFLGALALLADTPRRVVKRGAAG